MITSRMGMDAPLHDRNGPTAHYGHIRCFPPVRESRTCRQPRSDRARLWRDALSAGKKPPTRPRAAEKTRPSSRIPGVTRNWNAISENDWKFVVLDVIRSEERRVGKECRSRW